MIIPRYGTGWSCSCIRTFISPIRCQTQNTAVSKPFQQESESRQGVPQQKEEKCWLKMIDSDGSYTALAIVASGPFHLGLLIFFPLLHQSCVSHTHQTVWVTRGNCVKSQWIELIKNIIIHISYCITEKEVEDDWTRLEPECWRRTSLGQDTGLRTVLLFNCMTSLRLNF